MSTAKELLADVIGSPAETATALPHRDPTGFFEYMHAVVRGRFGKPGTWGHGRHAHPTRKGPGRRRVMSYSHPAGTKLVRKFIRAGASENVEMRILYAELTGYQYGETRE